MPEVGHLVGVGEDAAQAAQVAVAEAWQEEAPSPHLDTSQFPQPSSAHGKGGVEKGEAARRMLCRRHLEKPMVPARKEA
ncbi:UNVERIFIED_CONTAM: hypothetical protein K2H54_034474 [Gekko kuhli]